MIVVRSFDFDGCHSSGLLAYVVNILCLAKAMSSGTLTTGKS